MNKYSSNYIAHNHSFVISTSEALQIAMWYINWIIIIIFYISFFLAKLHIEK